MDETGDSGHSDTPTTFDPYAIVGALERHRVSYVVIGAFARTVHGTAEVTRGIDITPSLRRENVTRLNRALAELGTEPPAGDPVTVDDRLPTLTALRTRAGEVKVVPIPQGSRGYDDLRRHATREAIGRGLRTQVASAGDLARMLGALDDPAGQAKLLRLRRLIELGRGLDFGLEL